MSAISAVRSRLCRVWCLAATLILATGGGANAQPLELVPSPVSAPVIQTVSNDYWIVSSRRCGDRLECCQRCSFDVFHFDCHGHGGLSSLDEFYASLVPATPICFMLHGSFVEWESVCQDSRITNAWLRNACPERPLHTVFYTWPSDDTPAITFPMDVLQLGRRAERNGLYMAELISRVPDSHPVCLLGHSHGARMTLATLHALGGGDINGVVFAGGQYHGHRIRAVLAAAAIDHQWLNTGSRYERAVLRAESIVNLQSRKDLALKFYPLHRPFCTQALARTGFTDHVRREIGPQSVKLADYDVTPLVGFGHVWPHYYGQPCIAQAISTSVFFPDVVQIATKP